MEEARTAIRVSQGDDAPLVDEFGAQLAVIVAMTGDDQTAQAEIVDVLPRLLCGQPLFRFRGLYSAGVVDRLAGRLAQSAQHQAAALAGLGNEEQDARRRHLVLAEQMHLAVPQQQFAYASRIWPMLRIATGTVPGSGHRAELLVRYAEMKLAAGSADDAVLALTAAQSFWRGQPKAAAHFAGEVN